jgi:hypothetical protein
MDGRAARRVDASDPPSVEMVQWHVHPDGKRVLLSVHSEQRRQDVYVVENFIPSSTATR